MNLRFEGLDHNNLNRARMIDRSDISEGNDIYYAYN